MFLGAISSVMMLFLFVRRLWAQVPVLDSPLFIVSVMFMIMGFQSILMGLIAELLVRTYHEAQSKPTYTLRRVIRGHKNSDESLLKEN